MGCQLRSAGSGLCQVSWAPEFCPVWSREKCFWWGCVNSPWSHEPSSPRGDTGDGLMSRGMWMVSETRSVQELCLPWPCL